MKTRFFALLLMRVGLALAVLGSAFAFVPQAAAANRPHTEAGWYAPSAALTWTAKLVNRQVRMAGSGFPKDRPYYVKARSNATKAWVRIGRIRTNLKGAFEAELNLPAQWSNSGFLTVCLKDIITNNLHCKVAKR